MNESMVLIVNPLNSSLKKPIIESLISNNRIDYLSLDMTDPELNKVGINPSLVLVLLDNWDGENIDINKFQELPNVFPSTPTLSVINTSLGCEKCLDCQSFTWNFIHTPVTDQDINLIISWYIKNGKQKKPESTEFYLKQRSLVDIFVGESSETIRVKDKILRIAPYDVTVLLQGETGSGKELSAKLIHYLSNRSKGPFIAVNCGAIPTELFENELFGHRKGAYTHADSTEEGLVYSAHGGTLFLDEIGSLPLNSQVKLLRFIEEKKYKPLGQTSTVTSDVRIIAATNKNLADLVEAGKFRDDLFYRLSVVNINISPLKDRRDDIPLLVKHFLERFSKIYSKKIKGIKPEAWMHLMYYSWPGNIREMQNILQEAVILSTNNWIEAENLNFKKHSDRDRYILKSFQETKKHNIEEFERDYLRIVLKLFKGNVSKASEFAKKDRREFYRLINKYKIQPDLFRFLK